MHASSSLAQLSQPTRFVSAACLSCLSQACIGCVPNSFIHSLLTSLVCISATDECTELECIIPYAMSACLVWPALAWALKVPQIQIGFLQATTTEQEEAQAVRWTRSVADACIRLCQLDISFGDLHILTTAPPLLS
jgi:hypothetical protein